MASVIHATLLFATLIVLLSLYQINVAAQAGTEGCSISVSGLGDNSPLILKPENRIGMRSIHMPLALGSDFLNFSSGESVRFACPEVKNNVLVIIGQSEVNAVCTKGSIFTINKTKYSFSSFRCDIPPKSDVKKTGICRDTNVLKGIIGFNLIPGFIQVIEACYDTARAITLRASHILNRNIVTDESEVDRKNDILLELLETPDKFYTCQNQIDNLGKLLGSQIHAKRYITCGEGGDMYLVKAHLVPRKDFLYGYQQKISSYYINTAPQWQTINAGNWRILENKIRRYANDHYVDLEIITGTLNVTTLPNLYGMEQSLYLTKGERNNGIVPVPAIIWKIVYNSFRNAGIVFLVANNPYIHVGNIQNYVICDCVCNQTTSWFDQWNRFDSTKGYVYCCAVDEFIDKSGIERFSFEVSYLLR